MERPSELLYRVGQVVQLTENAFRGVIVGWEVENEVRYDVYYHYFIVTISLV